MPRAQSVFADMMRSLQIFARTGRASLRHGISILSLDDDILRIIVFKLDERGRSRFGSTCARGLRLTDEVLSLEISRDLRNGSDFSIPVRYHASRPPTSRMCRSRAAPPPAMDLTRSWSLSVAPVGVHCSGRAA